MAARGGRAKAAGGSTGAAAGAAPPAEEFDHHGGIRLRGLQNVPRSSIELGRFGRMFRSLPPVPQTEAALTSLAQDMAPAAAAADSDPAGDNPDIPSGYTYLGQFVDHDITFDPVSVLEQLNDPDGLNTFRTPRYDLDSLYGWGRAQSPYLYDQEDPVKLLVGKNTATIHEPEDLPRNQQGRALIGDPRNDVHVIVSQLHLAFIKFHNAIVDHLRSRFTPESEVFEEARRLTCWHYQWAVVHDYVRRLAPDILDDVLVDDPATGGKKADLRFFKWKKTPFMPVEFSVAAFRFGHSQVRANYKLNAGLELIPMFSVALTPNPLQHLGGFRPLPKKWKIEWKRFFPIGTMKPQPSRRIDTKISSPMHKLPQSVDRQRRSLALLNLLRGQALQLPSGQAVAAAMGTARPDSELGLNGNTPLWFYLLKEAEVVGEGRRLGPTGGRIVTEVLIGLLSGDPSSFLRQEPGWKPELPSKQAGAFTMADLLRFAGVA